MNAIIRPNADISVGGWNAIPSGARYDKINKIVTAPTVPSKDTGVYPIESYSDFSFGLETLANVQEVTKITINAYLNNAQSEELQITLTGLSSDNIYPEGEGWTAVEKPGLHLTQAQLDAIQFNIQYNGASMECTMYALYLDVEYTEVPPSGADPLPKRRKIMSGYNYFLSNYILRKNLSLPPYKLPDGSEMFD
jgi:hypothetical protein